MCHAHRINIVRPMSIEQRVLIDLKYTVIQLLCGVPKLQITTAEAMACVPSQLDHHC